MMEDWVDFGAEGGGEPEIKQKKTGEAREREIFTSSSISVFPFLFPLFSFYFPQFLRK